MVIEYVGLFPLSMWVTPTKYEGFEMAKQKNTPERVDVTGKDMNGKTMGEALQAYIGQPVSIICARFNYCGIVSSVGQDYVILANAHAIEESGPSSGERPVTSDCITSSVVISLAAVVIVMQPRWCFHNFE